MKQFVIIGCGRFGSSVAKTLYRAGYNVLAIDRDEDTIQEVSEYTTHAVQMDATDESSLRSLGIRNFDVAVVAIGSDIQSSILITLMVKEMGVKYVVAKALDELQGKVLTKIGADRIIYPERDMGVRVAQNLISVNILDNIELLSNYSVFEIVALKEWIGKSLQDLNLRKKYGITALIIKSGDKVTPLPESTAILKENDILIVLGNKDDLKNFDIV
ncbi:potassium channel family protein [Alkaliphilus serpentinus]|uniref:TrkA family potassium uptake protein n=1 Tax=Alkaliphilus serpentinus TaxID=1482731 RepID=A0A833MCD8_9FIRM|nr:TrkA family potassium uptake protein [Alkaliphilus serpentinus]KAB3524437.1 TrkA family potassium uptake protein [Alkaliphilus serpentinus]